MAEMVDMAQEMTELAEMGQEMAEMVDKAQEMTELAEMGDMAQEKDNPGNG